MEVALAMSLEELHLVAGLVSAQGGNEEDTLPVLLWILTVGEQLVGQADGRVTYQIWAWWPRHDAVYGQVPNPSVGWQHV